MWNMFHVFATFEDMIFEKQNTKKNDDVLPRTKKSMNTRCANGAFEMQYDVMGL